MSSPSEQLKPSQHCYVVAAACSSVVTSQARCRAAREPSSKTTVLPGCEGAVHEGDLVLPGGMGAVEDGDGDAVVSSYWRST